MHLIDHEQALTDLAQEYSQRSPNSAAVDAYARRFLVDGGSHTIRLIQPFPPRLVSAQGGWFVDEDGHRVLDLWQGHLANLLGHNPPEITSVLSEAFGRGHGLQTGFADRCQAEAAEILCRQTGSEQVRFTTSGSLATMYAIMLARAHTGRPLVMKAGGGWHGAQPWGLVGVHFHNGFEHVEGEGMPAAVAEQVVVTRFNDLDMLADHVRQHGRQAACLILEPMMGAGGLIHATPEYMQAARDWTRDHGMLLILDEVVSGFRFRPGDTGALYGIKPDLATFGKIIGGGMPVAAVAGRADVLGLVGRASGNRVHFSGGTYSAHPASMLAAKTMLTYLVQHESEVYPRLAGLGQRLRRVIEQSFAQEGFFARCTGEGPFPVGSSMAMVHFPFCEETPLDRPEIVNDPALFDVTLRDRILELALLLHDVHLLRSHGAVATAHTEQDLDYLEEACCLVARRLRRYLVS